MKLLEKFKILLLDMNSTFMFGEDRFSPKEDYYSTYLSLGGVRLSSVEVVKAIQSCYEGMIGRYEDLKRCDDFLGLEEGFSLYTDIKEEDLPHLMEVFTYHELGKIPPLYAKCIKDLATTHQLGLVSNIWAGKERWISELEKAEIKKLFKTLIFSSDTTSVKPSPRLFHLALESFDFPLEEILFIGDSLKRDMAGAKGVGLPTLWINEKEENDPLADYVLPNLLSLREADLKPET